MNRQQKVAEVEEIQGLLRDAELVVLTKYSGMGVGAMHTLRKELRAVGGGYRVVKNTLARRATAGTPMSRLDADFMGPVGVAYAKSDAAGLAKVLVNFVKDNPTLEFKRGMLGGGSELAPGDIQALATMPSRDQLRGMLLGALGAVPRGFVSLLAAVPRGFVGVLAARARALEQA
jgi:large subunit ribosomal protein L10